MLTVLENTIQFRREGEVLQAEVFGKGIIRVRAGLDRIREENWTLLTPGDVYGHPAGELNGSPGGCPDESAVIRLKEQGAVLKAGDLQLEISRDGRLSFLDGTGRVLLREFWADERDVPARVLKNRGGGMCHIEQFFRAEAEEHFYGLGQEAHDQFDLKGSVLDLCQQNTKSTIPFVVSSKGYGFVWNNPAIGRVEFGNSRTRWVAEEAVQLDYLVIGGGTPAEILKRYFDLTGHSPELPYWATGLWQSKLRYETQDELMEVAREYKRRGIDLSLIVCDYFHWPQQGEWKFDRRYWPDPEGMVRELSEMGIRLLVSVWPTVDMRSENFSFMQENNMLIRSERGPFPLFICRGPESLFDSTNPEARTFVWERIKENYYRLGIRNFWLDEAEPELTPYDYDNLHYHLGNGMQVSSLYPFYYAKAFYDGQRAEGQEEIVNLIRCAWLGSQRFGVVLWSGDIMSDFDSLRRQIKTGLHVAVSGIPWWTTDIGGFHGGDVTSPAYRELFVRWFQFGAFCPVFRMHGFRDKPDRPKASPYSLDSCCYSGGPNEIWSYGEEACEILSHYVEIRERLRTYIFEELKKTSEEGIPLMRPLFYDYPEQEVYDIFDEYHFGPDILVCPVYEAGAGRRKVYLPAGECWVFAGDGREFKGGQWIEVPAPLASIPLFARKGGRISAEILR